MATSGGVGGINMSEQQYFHQRCGRRITLSNDNRTAARSIRDFNHALVFSAEPLVDDVLFEVVIEQKNQSWGGSIEIGVTSELPDSCDLPSCALALRNGTWVMSGSEIRVDGNCLLQFYGTDLESLNENDRVGVLRTSSNDLEFYVNGESQGVAARNMPKTLWALVDLYGRCVQVSVCPGTDINARGDFDSFSPLTQQIIQCIDMPMCLDVITSSPFPNRSSFDSDSSFTFGNILDNNSSSSICATVPSNRSSVLSNIGDYIDQSERLRFHTRCGSLVKLSPNCRSAERRRPLDEFNNGVVMTHRPLRDNELFEIRIDKLVDKWSGSIEVGVTTHNPTVLNFPATMTNMRSGTIMMSGCGILTNGKGTRRQYGEFNLDELREGDRVGMMRKSNGNLHYYINGQDQGVAATRVANVLWGVIDLYGMTIKVTIVDRDEREQQNLVTRRNNIASMVANNSSQSIQPIAIIPALNLLSPEIDCHTSNNQLLNLADTPPLLASSNQRSDDRLTFNPLCGSHAAVTLSGRTALRPNASDDFNNGVVLTRRPLRPNELFQVRLERVVTKWAGSVEMGVTTYSAEELEFPFTMTNVRSGTWMMTGNGVMHNGVTVIEQYGQNLDRLQVGDRVGVVRKDDGTLHFWVNGADQGPAATNVPERVYGVIDLYGQAAQASIIDTSECGSPDTGNSTISNTTLYSETPLRFNTIHGKNAGISNSGLTASRPNSLAEFNDAIVFSNRPLRQRELFEVALENMVRHWSGNIEIGVTGTRPEDIQMASNATDLDAPDTIVLCGPMVFHNRKTILSNWLIDLDTLGVGARVGVMRNQDFIHFFIDGVDQGPACECRSTNIWAVIDLYGQCAQVSLTLSQPDIRAPYATSENSQSLQATSVIQPANLDTKHRWTCITGNVSLSQNWTVASRLSGATAALSHCIVFSEHPLGVGSPFEIKISSHNALFAGSLKIGVTDLNLSDDNIRKNIPSSIKRIPANVWYVSGNEVRKNDALLQRSMASLEWLRVGDRVALELTPARTLRILLNSEDMKIQFQNVPNDVYVVAELQGATMAIQVISSQGPSSPLRPCSLRLQDSLDFGADPLNKQDSMLESIDSEAQAYEFSDFCGKNIRLLDERRSATRFQSYGHGLVFLAKPLCRGESVCIKVDSLNDKWKGTIGVGVIGTLSQVLNLAQLPPCIMQLRKPCWAVTSDFINLNGQKIASKYAECLDQLQPGAYISLTLTHEGNLYLIVNLKSLEVMASGLPSVVYPVFDLFGKCDKITILSGPDAARNGTPILEAPEPLEHDTSNDQLNSLPQREKADLEVHEKELDTSTNVASCSGVSSTMHRSVMESVSDNLVWNMSIKNRTLEQSRLGLGSSCSQLESLQLQHNTNLNIQRSQSTQRFQNTQNLMTSSTTAPLTVNTTTTSNIECIHDTNKDSDALEAAMANLPSSSTTAVARSDRDSQERSSSSSSNLAGTSTSRFLLNLLTDITTLYNQPNVEPSDNDEVFERLYMLQHLTLHNDFVRERTSQNQDNQDPLQQLNFDIPQPVSLDSLSLEDTASSCGTQFNSLQQDAIAQYDSMQLIIALDQRDCDYFRLVETFCESLVLPQTFFPSIKTSICFCEECNGISLDKLNGWVYFKLNQHTVNSNPLAENIPLDTGDWVPLYYLTRVDKIRATLDHGQPIPLEGSCESHSQQDSQKDEPGTKLELHFSPNTLGLPILNSQHNYRSQGEKYHIGTAFEVYVRRHSLCSTLSSTRLSCVSSNQVDFVPEIQSTSDAEMPCGLSAASMMSEAYQASCHESTSVCNLSENSSGTAHVVNSQNLNGMTWFTKEAGACVITALILKLEKYD